MTLGQTLVARDGSTMTIDGTSGMSAAAAATIGALSGVIGMLLVVIAVLVAKFKSNRIDLKKEKPAIGHAWKASLYCGRKLDLANFPSVCMG